MRPPRTKNLGVKGCELEMTAAGSEVTVMALNQIVAYCRIVDKPGGMGVVYRTEDLKLGREPH